jgi:hypothetical protein
MLSTLRQADETTSHSAKHQSTVQAAGYQGERIMCFASKLAPTGWLYVARCCAGKNYAK